MNTKWPLYIGTILLEKNRHTGDRKPTYRVSEWTERFRQAGLDGTELWEYHATRADDAELEALAHASVPTAVFNSYAALDADGRAERALAGRLARQLGAWGIKFNVGKDPAARTTYLEELRRWRSELPDDLTLLCECHPGTIVEEPVEAKRFLADLDMAGWGVIVHPFSRLESLSEWLDTFGPAVMHTHLQMRDPANVPVRFDRRPERVRAAVRLLRTAGFSGSCTFEFTEGMNVPGEDIEALWENALRDLRFLREELAA
jgi:sugar phosphate isomerase/epimerase